MANSWFRVFGGLVLPAVMVLSSAGRAETFTIYAENDSRYLKPNHNTDRHYTNGFKLVYGFQPNWRWLDGYGQMDVPFFPAPQGPVETAAGVFLGQNIYTPDYVDEPAKRRLKDMRFAGWLYSGLFVQRANEQVLDQAELSLGVIGPSAKGRQIQTCVHEAMHSGRPIGWDSQLGDRPAVDFSWYRKHRLQGAFWKPSEKIDFLSEYGFTAGSVFCHLQASVVGRFGFWELPKDWGPDRLELPAGAIAEAFRKEKAGYFFVRLGGRAVGYNQFLTDLDPEPLVGHLQVGCVIQLRSLELGYSQTYLTQEYKEQNYFDGYGALTVKWDF
ncbi:MAG TPA: lipid A deacylase LpxR family protein [Anaerohalosphaeraceae bacterium]|nr:lipid A deacylase LpxR family protein [Anaerohalosphaeraceae bacterium]HOL88456.1 lipid A deacylase LpxR family protein [Anaerohalosphaeraceae bacterium]HPP56967.1 lipid A deacylase LpxR family protein [Anaerohalosphaeraceae bacterium]